MKEFKFTFTDFIAGLIIQLIIVVVGIVAAHFLSGCVSTRKYDRDVKQAFVNGRMLTKQDLMDAEYREKQSMRYK